MNAVNVYQDILKSDTPFVIAEIGVNYYDIAVKEGITPMAAAKLMIDQAHLSGANAVKFQTYKAGKIASKNSPAYWDRREEPTGSQYELFLKFDRFGEKEYRELADYAQFIGTIFLSTPFDYDAADYLDELMPVFKISSSDITNLPFMAHIAKKGKPVFLATGASTIAEIEVAYQELRKNGVTEICLMHCVLSYPTGNQDANLQMIKHLRAVFPECMIGYSDHTRPDESMLILTTAYQYGAKVIEKHFTLDKSLPGNDHYHAMDPNDLKKFRSQTELIRLIDGQYYKEPLPCEQESRKQARRSIVAKLDMKKGEVLTLDKVTFKRPGTGISPKDLDKVLGRELKEDVKEDSLIQWNNF